METGLVGLLLYWRPGPSGSTSSVNPSICSSNYMSISDLSINPNCQSNPPVTHQLIYSISQLSTCLSNYLLIHLFTCLSIYLSIHLSVDPSRYLTVSPSSSTTVAISTVICLSLWSVSPVWQQCTLPLMVKQIFSFRWESFLLFLTGCSQTSTTGVIRSEAFYHSIVQVFLVRDDTRVRPSAGAGREHVLLALCKSACKAVALASCRRLPAHLKHNACKSMVLISNTSRRHRCSEPKSKENKMR